MGKDRGNRPPLSPKKPRPCCAAPTAEREVERLGAALEAERSRGRQAHRKFSLELRRAREEAGRQRDHALRDLTSRLERQKALELHRLRAALDRDKAAEVKRLLRRAGGAAGPGCLGNAAAYRKLDEVLQSNGRSARLRRLRHDLDLERGLFLCHLLDAHGCPQEGEDPTGPSPRAGWSISEGVMQEANGADYSFLVRQNAELLRALEELEKTCATLRDENGLLRKSSCPETEEKVKRLRRKNTELALIAKRLEDRAHKLQEANMKVVNVPMPVKPGVVEQYKRAFARQRARDLAQHADSLLSKDKEIAALQQECRQLEARLGQSKDSPDSSAVADFERLLRESQKEVLRLQRQLSVSSTQEVKPAPDSAHDITDIAVASTLLTTDDTHKSPLETPSPPLDDAPPRCQEAPVKEKEPWQPVTPPPGPSPAQEEEPTEEQRVQFLESELSKKRKECEGLEHEVRKRQKRCQDLESQLEEECSRNERLEEETQLLRRKAQLLEQSQCENDGLREEVCTLGVQYRSALDENQKLRAKLENLEQVLKHMREVAERRQKLELEHEQALAILKFKQEEIKRLQRAQLFAKREHEGVVQMLEELVQLVLHRELAKVRELEGKCRSQSEQFSLLSQELDRFRLHAAKIDLASSGLLSGPALAHLTNGLGLSVETGPIDPGAVLSLGDIAFWTLEGTDVPPGAASEQDLEAVLTTSPTPIATGLARPQRSPATKHRELPTLGNTKSTSTSSTPKSDSAHLTPKSGSHPHSPRKASPVHEVDTASEVEELDIDVSPAPYSASRGAAKLQVFIARYSYNPYDGPNDNPEVELPLTAGEYIYMYGDMDDDGFYEGELMDGRRGLVPSNFVERVSDDDIMNAHPPETGELSHNSFQDSSFHSSSFQHNSHQHPPHPHHVRFAPSVSEPTDSSARAVSTPSPRPGPSPSPTHTAPVTNGLDLDLEEVGVDTVPYPRKLTLIKQLAKSAIIGWDAPAVPAGWGSVWSYNVYVDQELRLNVPFGSQTKAVLERLDVATNTYRVSVQSLTDRGGSDQLRCTMLVGQDACVAPSALHVDRVTATSATLTWLPSNSNYVHVVSLNEEECELVKAGCYSLCLANLAPSLRYQVKVEARPHRTPWEMPPEQRERKAAVTCFSTLTAGPPDAPLDVQLEQGPSAGIALVSWLPVTIDATGTSNGVSVTGYTIYADKKKVLEVASPTAGSALLGPSQIQSLQSAQELTVRTMSAHGESPDSVAVNVQAKLPAIMTGTKPSCPPVPALSSAASELFLQATPPSSCSAAKTSTPAYASLPDVHVPSPGGEGVDLKPNAVTINAPLPAASYAEAWATPSSAASIAEVLAAPTLAPSVSSNPQMSVTLSARISPTQEPSRDTDSPGAKRPAVSIAEFLEDPCAKTHVHQPVPVPKPRTHVPEVDPLDAPETHPLRPPNPSPLESEAEEDLENARLVSIEEFLRPALPHLYQGYSVGLMEPSNGPQADSSRGSDLSDILEEEEEDLYSESAGEVRGRGYSTAGATGRPDVWELDSDEEVLERILKLPAQTCNTKQLFSIPEVTEEEDNSAEEAEPRRRLASRGEVLARGILRQHLPSSLTPPKRSAHPARPRPQLRVHYADTVEEEEADSDSSLYAGPDSREVWSRRSRPPHHTHDRDRLRKEALRRSHMTSDLPAVTAALPTAGPSTDGGPYMLSRTIHRVKSPTGPGVEIDVEYGTDNDEDPARYEPGEVVVEQMSSEWWVEGSHDYHRPIPAPRRPKAEQLAITAADHHQWDPQLTETGAAWCPPDGISAKVSRPGGRRVKEIPDAARLVRENEMRIFVALFPYDPVTMSPNPDAAEEELPFQEGQIIKVYGDKDADGFYHGESSGRLGYVPCNMVSEIQVEDEETREQLLQQGFLSTDASMEKIGSAAATDVQGPGPRRMVAIFDYDPRESSPNADIEAELTFSAGDVIYVFGDMDDDGFFYGELNGHKGLVPSNFLRAFPEAGEGNAGGAGPHPVVLDGRRDLQVSDQADPAPAALLEEDPRPCPDPEPRPANVPAPPTNLPPPADSSPPGKKKKGFFSKGRKLFKKLGSGRKES
ncbi:peripheral-type benzodiazepine receptor-associated protein 1 isoform X7 [Denticeps clupeoides]|uniref:peripheral-type benzodiazepine receptor-associated protein 1 isoform X7 n=1 Tax=Denticeps clupeoides TaxID=299321 RepID=UPI0010A41AFF|nr:peripheral-type benzodiazepine receptor-associated protein 1 isoform X7 [Denticeps clupeoides]